ncbi:hypothetical protein CAEBREN_24318 [Caenorhabditis brenneri]|uniref:Glycine zipper domain-containing protein n=1 Tax=Caenorhabditis brenneri TaxID=135651 RepID=G0N3C0_CAEBE|nr:hypothetical protein CAEBREN_24318 [Caenorhabditis brenneri]
MSSPTGNREVENIGNSDYSEDQNEEMIDKLIRYAAVGFTVGAMNNAARYDVEVGGRRSNFVTVYDRNVINSRGDAEWLARYDGPHAHFPHHHINMNRAITGFPDPHTRISETTARIARRTGQALDAVNTAAPYLTAATVAHEAYRINNSLKKDLRNQSSRNTVKNAATTTAATVAAYTASRVGASIGTAILPGIGTMIGGLIGGVLGGIGGGIGSENASEAILDTFDYDIDYIFCRKCNKQFQYRRYHHGRAQKLCPICR